MKGEKPFVLDLGAAKVTVERSDQLEPGCAGRADYRNYKILLDANLNGQEVTSTLLHECLHHMDGLFLAGALDKDGDPGHKYLDQITVLFDMLISRNWKIFRDLYDAKAAAEVK